MPNEVKHQKQYQINKEFLQKIDLLEDKFNCWKITTLFYCAVHKIEKFLSKDKISKHPQNHYERAEILRLMRKFNNLNEGVQAYINLYQLSRKARYECEPIDLKRVTDAKDDLRMIEKYFN